MRIHFLEHEPFEGLGNIEVWAKNKGHSITRTHLFNNEELSDISEFDWLFIMGGSMNIYEENKFPWLKTEKEFIAKAIAANKIHLRMSAFLHLKCACKLLLQHLSCLLYVDCGRDAFAIEESVGKA